MRTPMKKVFTLLLFGLLLSSCSLEQLFLKGTKPVSHPVTQTPAYKALNPYQQDYLFAARLIRESYPDWESILSPVTFDSLEQAGIAALALPCSPQEFRWELQRLLATFHNDHTRQLKSWYPKEPLFYPYRLNYAPRDAGYGWYIERIDSIYGASWIGCWVDQIANRSLDSLSAAFGKMTAREHEYGIRDDLYQRWLFSRPRLLARMDVDTAQSLTLKCSCPDGPRELRVAPGSGKSFNLQSRKPRRSHSKPRRDGFWYQAIEDKGYGYFQFNGMFDREVVMDGLKTYVRAPIRPLARLFIRRDYRRAAKGKPTRWIRPDSDDFDVFLQEVITDLNAKNLRTLVIDLRNNGGGDLEMARPLLYALAPQAAVRPIPDYIYLSPLSRSQFKEEWKTLGRACRELGHPMPADGTLVNIDSLEIAAGLEPADFFAPVMDPRSPVYFRPPVPEYNGQVVFLVGPQTGSAAAGLATLVKDNGIGQLVGTVVSERPEGASVVSRVNLPNSKDEISISVWYKKRPAPEAPKDLLLPDHWVEADKDSYLNSADPVLDWVEMHLIGR